MRKKVGEPLTYEDVIKAAEAGDAAFHRWDAEREYTSMLSRKSALFVDQICEVLNKYPKRTELCQITTNSWSPLERITNGYFTVMYNPIRGECFVSVNGDNVPLRNYLDSGGDCHVTNLEELEKFCETARFIGGMGDEHPATESAYQAWAVYVGSAVMKYDNLYMDIAERVSQESYAKRLKVGAAILTENGGLFCGFNGTLPGFINQCEKEDGSTDESITSHAEQNSLYKMLKEGVSAKGATIYLTHSPCSMCCKMIISSGIKRVVYKTAYRDTNSLQILEKANLVVEKWEE